MHRALRLLLIGTALLVPFTSHAQWQLDGIPVGTLANMPNSPTPPFIIADGSGGAVIVWEDFRSGSTPDIYAQRVDVMGATQWTVNGVAICTAAFSQKRPTVVSDGSGGVIIAWDDDRAGTANRDIYVQRVNGAGVVQWAANGVPVCTATNHQDGAIVVSDGAGGAIVTWRDQRAASLTYHLYAQRVNASGVPQWTADGIAVHNTSSMSDYAPVADGAGGAIVAFTNGSSDMYAQRLNSSGTMLWGASGAPVCTAANYQGFTNILSDGSGGAILAWSDTRSGNADIYAQRVNGVGAPQWTANGVLLCNAANDQYLFGITTNGSGGMIATWQDYRTGSAGTYNDIYVQAVSSAGVPQWTANGVAVCTANYEQFSPRIASDQDGGAIVTWADSRLGPSSGDIYAQRINGAGTVQWTANGVAVCVTGNPVTPTIASNSAGGALVVWADSRNGAYDIYAQRMEKRYGYWGRPDGWITSVADVPGDQGGHVMSTWRASDRDVFPAQEISHYTLWRELTAAAVSALTASAGTDAFVDASTIGPDFTGKAYRQVSTAAGTTSWEYIATIPIRYATEYGFNTPTLADSIAVDPADAAYQVLSHTTNAFVYYEGNVFTGHSVDNLAPAAPLYLTAQRVGADVHLKWNRVRVSDLRDYSVYRATSSGVNPLPVNFLSSVNDTVLVDGNAPTSSLYYIVTAYDVHANQSAPSNEAAVSPSTGAGDLPPITSLMLLQNRPNPFSTRATFELGLPAATQVDVAVYDVAGRRVKTQSLGLRAAGWQTVTLEATDNAGHALASGVYFYRITASGTTITRKMVIAR